MYKIASVALTALGVAGIAQSSPAEAHPFITVGIGLPGVAVIEPFAYAPAYYGPYYYAHGRYWRHDYDWDRYDHDRFRHDHWDRR
jgi:hypothetical protein